MASHSALWELLWPHAAPRVEPRSCRCRARAHRGCAMIPAATGATPRARVAGTEAAPRPRDHRAPAEGGAEGSASRVAEGSAEGRCGEHRVCRGAEAAAQRLVVFVVSVVRTVGLGEVDRVTAGRVEELGGYHLSRAARACRVHRAVCTRRVHIRSAHSLRFEMRSCAEYCQSTARARPATCLHRAHHRTAAAAAACTAATRAEIGQPQPAHAGLLKKVLPQVITLGQG